MPEPVKPVVPVAAPAPKLETPAAPVPSGRDMIRQAKGAVDYSEDFSEGAPVVPAPAPAAAAPPAPAPTPDPKEAQLKEAQTRQRILEIEAARLQGERDLLLQQQRAAVAAPEPEVDLAAIFQEDPLRAMQIVAERTAKSVREETLKEMQTQQSAADFADTIQAKKNEYASNLKSVFEKHPELNDQNHRLTQIAKEIEGKMPYLLTVPDGPLQTIELAMNQYELEKLKSSAPAAPTTPEAISDAEKRGKASEAARQESVRVASLVAGPTPGAPPPASVALTKEQEYAARRLRMSNEEYSRYLQNTPKFFKQEEAPRRVK